MNRKIFTILSLVVFMLMQFGSVSAATVGGTVTVAPLPVFHGAWWDFEITWSVENMNGVVPQYMIIWSRIQASPANLWTGCYDAADVSGAAFADGTDLYPNTFFDQNTVEFKVTVDDEDCGGITAGNPTAPATALEADASTFIDFWPLRGFIANPPSLGNDFFTQLPVACNTFELWGLVSDQLSGSVAKTGFDPSLGYSGFDSWNESVVGAFAPPAPLGPGNALLSWIYTIPATASGDWSFLVNPTDFAGNDWGDTYFRDFLAISSSEKKDCLEFPDTGGTDTEVYVRYMAQLGLAHGYLDGTFMPGSTLTRAEMAAFIELANGVKDTDPLFGTPPVAGSACEFSDVNSADWFAGWVWQACADGYMIGLGGGLFGSYDTLTRGQVVTVLNNINIMGVTNGYLATENVFQNEWGTLYREAPFVDVPLGAFYTIPVQNAYGVGVADGTSETTFSPDQAILRGEFTKMMYRALSRIQSGCVECKQ